MKYQVRLGALSFFVMAASAAFAQSITVLVNGNPVAFPQQGPIVSNDRILVPLRGVLEQIGAHVDWDPATQTVSAHRQGTDVKLHIGQTDASVNGQPVTLDVPAQIINGSTMVPLRFVSEALGENVTWDAPSHTVSIKDSGDYDLPKRRDHDHDHDHDQPPPPPPPPVEVPPPPPPPQEAIFDPGTVIPVRLDDELNSDVNQRGDRFSGTIQGNDAGLPQGTKLEGVVVDDRPQRGPRPGMIEVKFDRIDFPDGQRYPIAGSLIGMSDRSVFRRPDGRWVAKPNPNPRALFVGVGSGSGLILGVETKRPIESVTIGGLIGIETAPPQRAPNDVHLRRGTRFGVRLNRPLTVHLDDLH